MLDLLAEAYDALDPNGNITIKWDVINWTPDGYLVSITTIFFVHVIVFLCVTCISTMFSINQQPRIIF